MSSSSRTFSDPPEPQVFRVSSISAQRTPRAISTTPSYAAYPAHPRNHEHPGRLRERPLTNEITATNPGQPPPLLPEIFVHAQSTTPAPTKFQTSAACFVDQLETPCGAPSRKNEPGGSRPTPPSSRLCKKSARSRSSSRPVKVAACLGGRANRCTRSRQGS